MADLDAQGEVVVQELTGDQAPQSSGIEKRIDQLVAEREEYKRQMDAVQQQAMQREAQYLQMMERMALAQQSQVAAPQAPEIDPSIAQGIEFYLSKHLSPIQKQLAQSQQAAAALQARLAFQERAAGEDPKVVQKAQELLASWRRDPSKQGWEEADALIYARGMLGIAAPSPQQATRDALGRFNAGAGGLPGHSAPPPAVNQRKAVELDRSSTDATYLERQAALLEKELGDVEF